MTGGAWAHAVIQRNLAAGERRDAREHAREHARGGGAITRVKLEGLVVTPVATDLLAA